MSNFKSFIAGVDNISANLDTIPASQPSVQFPDHVIREYFALEDDDPIPTRISDDDRAEIYSLIEKGSYE